MISGKRIHAFDSLLSTEIDGGTVFEVEKFVTGRSCLLLETGDALLLETNDKILLEGSTTDKWINYKLTYDELLARIITDISQS